MAFKLVLQESSPETAKDTGEKDIGENVFVDNLQHDYKVYSFYYPAAMPNDELEGKLRQLGEQTGKNLYVNIGRLNDPKHDSIVQRFAITKYPVIVITALDALASSPGDYLTTYVRFDSPALLRLPERTLQCVQIVFNLFLRGEVAEAIAQAHSAQRAALLSRLGYWFADALKAIGGFIAERDISVSVLEGKFELKRSGA